MRQYRPRCGWRRRLSGRASSPALRRCLTAVLILECVVGVSQHLWQRIPVIQVEERGDVTWFVPEEGEEAGIYEMFGIQFRLKDGEVRVYRTRQEIKSH